MVTGLTKQLDKVTWKKPNPGGDVTNYVDGYKIDVGSYKAEDNSQTTILTVPGAQNKADAVYTCVIQSHEHGKTYESPEKTNVKSDVFSELFIMSL